MGLFSMRHDPKLTRCICLFFTLSVWLNIHLCAPLNPVVSSCGYLYTVVLSNVESHKPEPKPRSNKCQNLYCSVNVKNMHSQDALKAMS